MMVGADVRFQVSSITHANITKIEDAWPRIRSALLLAADFLRQAGYSSRTLTANNAAGVIAYWFFKIEADYSFLESSHTAADRSRIVSWVTRSLLKQGVWGSGVDTLITRLRAELENADTKHGFPAEALEGALASLGKSLTFDQVEIDAMLEWEYQGAKTKPLLTLLQNGLDGTKTFEEDHIFPKSLFTRSELLRRGVPAELVSTFISTFNTLPNLQLLVGTRNNEKLAMLPSDWLRRHFSSEADRDVYLSENFMAGLPLELDRFNEFMRQRRNALKVAIVKVLGTH